MAKAEPPPEGGPSTQGRSCPGKHGLLTDHVHRELEPAALDAAPGAFINKRAVYFAPFVSSGEKSTPSPLSLGECPGACGAWTRPRPARGERRRAEGPGRASRRPGASAPLPRAVRLGRGGCGLGQRRRRLFLPLPQGCSLLLLLRVALHVGAAALHLVEHPAAGKRGSSERSVPTRWAIMRAGRRWGGGGRGWVSLTLPDLAKASRPPATLQLKQREFLIRCHHPSSAE